MVPVARRADIRRTMGAAPPLVPSGVRRTWLQAKILQLIFCCALPACSASAAARDPLFQLQIDCSTQVCTLQAGTEGVMNNITIA